MGEVIWGEWEPEVGKGAWKEHYLATKTGGCFDTRFNSILIYYWAHYFFYAN